MEKTKQRKQKPVRKRPIPERLRGQVYIDPKFDTGFKELFDSEDALKDFLNGILQLEGDDKIKNLSFTFDTTITMRSSLSKKVILDIFATTGTGRFIDVEMQKAEHDFFIDRVVLYKAFLIIKGKQAMDHSKEFLALSKEERESKRYELPEAVSIFTKNKYIIISLPQFKKSAGEVKDSVDAWLYLLNHAGDGKELPDFGNKILEEALERIKVDNADDELLTRQEKDMVTKEEFSTIVASRVLRELAKARTEAQAEGLEEGRAEGRAEAQANALDILQGMNLSPEQISEFKEKLAALGK